MSRAQIKAWRAVPRAFFPFRVHFATRWSDNDQYGHVNNAAYHQYMDTTINDFLLRERVLLLPNWDADIKPSHVVCAGDATASKTIEPSCRHALGICAENGFHYFAPVSYPQDIECGLAATHLGRNSVTYRVGLFVREREGESGGGGDVANVAGDHSGIRAVGKFVHVFVDTATRRPVAELPIPLRRALERLLVDEPAVEL